MISGPELFSRYARPPNLLGYCGPGESEGLSAVAGGVELPRTEMLRVAEAFEGAWPYLELLAGVASLDPLSPTVVEAYWQGNRLLDHVDLNDWGHSVSDRFRRQAGARWPRVEEALNAGGLPNHAFHVFCVYPWVGLLRQGFVGPALEVLDRCRISTGTVISTGDGLVVVRRRPLVWVDDRLTSGDPAEEVFRPSSDDLSAGDMVSLHWDFVCRKLDRGQADALMRYHDRHLMIANQELRSARLEPVR